SGIAVNHLYQAIGNSTLTLTVSSLTGGKRIVSKLIRITKQTISYPNPFANFHENGYPPPNPLVVLPTSNDTGTVSITPTPPVSTGTTGTTGGTGTSGLSFILILGIGLLAALLVVGILLAIVSRRQRV